MNRPFAAICLVICLSASALCQSKPAFDIADVHFSPRSDWMKTVQHWSDGGFLGGDRYQIRRATMLDLIRAAYDVDTKKIFGGPSWVDYDRYEITAKTRPGTKPETVRQMLQTLLADRFHLVVKVDMQPAPGYILSARKGNLKITVAAADSTEPASCFDVGKMNIVRLQCKNMTMDEFAATLHPAGLPVLNSTGLDGAWDFELQYTLGNLAVGSDGSMLEALNKLGLKLEAGNVPQPVLTVVSADEKPSPNPPGVAEALPRLPDPEFDVASVRPCDPNGGGGSRAPQFQPGGRVTATCMPPGSLISEAWNVSSADDVVGLPKSFSGTTQHNITIVAKAPADVVPRNKGSARDTMKAMMRSLLTERYGMKFHFEDRPRDAYTLVTVKPKLTKADPENRTGCTANIQIFPGQGGVHELVCRNMTMTEFAEQAEAYLSGNRYPVTDETHLDGAWDFTIKYATLRHPSPQSIADGSIPEPVDPADYYTFTEAVEKQLGLKLELRKRPQPVLVIDHMEENPTEN